MTELARVPASHPIAVLREQIAPDASDAELAFFAQVCARLDLSPFADQIVLIGRYDKRVGRKVHRHQITVAGRRTLAARTGRLVRIDGPEWCGPRDENGGELVWRDVWTDDERPPYCARAFVVTAESKPEPAANGTAKWSEFVQTDQGGVPLAMWQRMPSHMLGKVAESMALRRAFPDVIEPAVANSFPVPVGPDGDDTAELAEAGARNAIHDDPPAPSQGQGPGGVVDPDWRPTVTDQGAAHRAVFALAAPEREQFLSQWDIDDFGEVWSPGAVADALGLELGSP